MRPNYPDTHHFSPHYVSQLKSSTNKRHVPNKELKQYTGNIFDSIASKTDPDVRKYIRKANI